MTSRACSILITSMTLVLVGCGRVQAPTGDGEAGDGDGPDAGQHVATSIDGGAGDDPSGDAAAAVAPDKIVFVSSLFVTGDMGGLAGADGLCQAAADEGDLPGEYRAWLSDQENAAADRLNHSTGDYLLVDGTVVAEGWDDLTDGTLAHPISRTETGDTAEATEIACDSRLTVWTGSMADGSPAENNCAGWSSQGVGTVPLYGIIGQWGLEDEGWSVMCSAGCGHYRPVYCIEQ